MIKKFLTVLLLCFLCIRPGLPNSPPYERITVETANQMMQNLDNFVLLDVRSVGEFRERHIAGAVLIPVNELERRSATELPDKNIAIFVYCRMGVRASNAATILAGKGYTQVFNIGGILDWPFQTVSGN